MKAQALISGFDSGFVPNVDQMNDANRYGRIVDSVACLPFSYTKAMKTNVRFDKQIFQKEYSAAERKHRAEAFIERSGRLKYYIGLIQLKVVTRAGMIYAP